MASLSLSSDEKSISQSVSLPVLDWVWFGPYHADGHTGIYTYGLRKFGKEEIEVYADADLNEVRDFLLDIVAYVVKPSGRVPTFSIFSCSP